MSNNLNHENTILSIKKEQIKDVYLKKKEKETNVIIVTEDFLKDDKENVLCMLVKFTKGKIFVRCDYIKRYNKVKYETELKKIIKDYFCDYIEGDINIFHQNYIYNNYVRKMGTICGSFVRDLRR